MILLIKRGVEPYVDHWALPGALVRPDENLDEAPLRILKDLTGISNVYLEQVASFGKVDRHPLGRIITVAYYSLVNSMNLIPFAASFAREVKWFPIEKIRKLPFDHNEILQVCYNRLKFRLRTRPIGFELLEEEFTLTDLQNLYETVLGKKLDKRNFRKKLLSMELLVENGSLQEGVPHRPAKLYRFNQDKYRSLVAEGFSFDL